MQRSKLLEITLIASLIFFSLAVQTRALSYRDLYNYSAGQVLGAGTPALAQSKTATGAAGNTVAAPFPNAVTAGNLIIAVAETDDGGAISLGDSLGDNFVLAKNICWDFCLRNFSLYYAANANAGADSVTLTSATSGGDKQLQIFEYSGMAAGPVLDQVSFTTALNSGGAGITSPAVTTTQPNELLFAAGGNQTSGSASAGTGYTLQAGTINGGAYIASEHQIVSSAGSYAASLNYSQASASGGIILAGFIASGSPAGNPPQNPPVISGVSASGISSAAAAVTWTTDSNSDSQVLYGPTNSYGLSSSLNPALTTSHSVNLSGLSPQTTYHYVAESRDSSGNLSVSADQTFTTLSAQQQGAAPSISSFTAAPTSISSGQSATLSWNVFGATSVTINNSVGSQANLTSGSVSVFPALSTTYTLTATNASGSNTAQASVTVNQASPAPGGSGTWTLKRAIMPAPTAATGMYAPVNTVPGSIDFQNLMFYNPLDRMVCAMEPDSYYGGGEWGNSLFCYAVNQDDGSSTSGAGTGWRLMWDSLNTQLNNNSGVGPGIQNISCAAGTVTVTTAANSAQFLRPGQTWLLAASMPAGFSSGMFKVTPIGAPTGPYGNLYTTFNYSDPSCANGSATPGANTYFTNADDYPDMPMRRHAEGMAFDTNRNAIWLSTGVGDANSDANVVNWPHTAITDLYKMTKTVNNGANWGWSEICGFGANSIGLTAAQLPGTGPGSLCGQEFLTNNTTGPQVAGLPCLDTTPGGITTGGNGGSCGYKFPLAGFDPGNDAFVLFGGEYNSATTRCETLLYYPATNTWKNPYNPNSGCGSTYPTNRWNTAGSRLVYMGNGKMLLFGGPGVSSYLGDTWIFQTCAQNNQSACGWTQVHSTTSPAPNPNPVMDWDPDIGKVVMVDYQSPAHYWFFDPNTLQWSDQGTGSGASLPSLTSGMSCTSGTGQNCTTWPYLSIGAYDAGAKKFVILNGCLATTNPACPFTRDQIWALDVGAGGSAPATGDTQAPSAPANLSAAPVSASQINLSWSAASDNVGVAGYKIFRGGAQIAVTAANTFSDTGLSASTLYNYAVSAYDAAGNVSPLSAQAGATTQSQLPASGPVITPLVIQELVYPGGIAGVARSQDPVTVGIPLADSQGVNSVGQLGLSGAAVGQFRVLGCWEGSPTPAVMATSCSGGGHIKWVLVDTQADINSPGAQNTAVSLTAGSGNFGGANLAADNGATITVNTGPGQFTVKKANFNVIDQAVVNGKTLVAPGTSQGMVVLGPNPTAAYPGNVTCQPNAGGTACNTAYSSANDPNSTCSIEENGPAKAVILCSGHHLDGAGHSYMAFTVREYFYYNQTGVKVTTELQNADYGTSNTYQSAAKGYQGYELRLTPSLSGALNYTFGNHTSSPTAGTMSGSDSVYLYQAESSFLKTPSWCGNHDPTEACVTPSPLSGYAIMKNGSPLLTGTAAQVPQGWADISDAGGAGLEIGQYQLGAYGNKSLEFQNGGKDVRVGIWAGENNTSSVTATSPSQPYYLAWPQYSINDVYLIFHSAAPASPANDFLKMQHYLVARASSVNYYNGTGAFMDPLLDPAEEANYYSNVINTANPPVAGSSIGNKDLGAVDSFNWPLTIWQWWAWPSPGVSNQMEFRYAHILDFLREGFTGDYIDSTSFYNMIAEKAFPRSDGFDWRSEPGNQTQYLDFPTAASQNSTLATRDWIEASMEHGYWWGMPDYYFLTGNETIHDAITDGADDAFLDGSSASNLAANGTFWNERAIGNALTSYARAASFLQATGDPGDAAAALALGQSAWNLQIKPDLCVSGYPAGCKPNTTGGSAAANQRGTSKVRGITYQWGQTITPNGCAAYPNNADRAFAAFQAGPLLRGMMEFNRTEGPGWSDYSALGDTAYGIDQALFGEMYADNGSNSWSGNGFRYYESLDIANNCNVGPGGSVNEYDFMVQNPNAFWPAFYYMLKYEGGTNAAAWQRKFNQLLQTVISGGAAIKDELYHYVIGDVIYALNHPSGASLVTVPITGVANNGSGSYTISWIAPLGAQNYRIKWGSKQIVDWIGYDSGTAAFIGDPVNTMNWFSAADAPNIPAPAGAGTVQTLTITGLPAGLTASDFMIKAYEGGATGNNPGSPDTAPPSVPTGLSATPVSSSQINLSWTPSTDNVGVTGYKIFRNGAQIATSASAGYSDSGLAAATGYTYAVSATDAAGNNSPQSAPVSASTPALLPFISNLLGSGTTASSTQISWNTNVATNGQVFYGLTSAYGSSSILLDNAPKTTAHAATLAGLSPATLYHFKVVSVDAANNSTSSPDFTFTTLVPPAAPAPVIAAFTASPSSISPGGAATLTWTISGNASSLSLNQNIGSVLGQSSKSVSPATTTTYTLTATNSGGSATAQVTLAVTAGGLPPVNPSVAPDITAFVATPPSVLNGQSSVLSWTVTGSPAPALSIDNGIGGVAGLTQTVNPGATTAYTLTATNSGGSATAQVTVTVTPVQTGSPGPSSNPSPAPSPSPAPNASGITVYIPPAPTPATTTPASTPLPPSASPALRLINSQGTYFLVENGVLHGITNPGILTSYGLTFTDAQTATPQDLALAQSSLLTPNDGALVKSKEDPTVYLISSQQRYAFTSARVFTALGFKFSSVLLVTNPELQSLPQAPDLSNPVASHQPGLDINKNGTIYWIGQDSQLHGYPSLSVYNSWHLPNDFSKVVTANAADLALPVGNEVIPRVIN